MLEPAGGVVTTRSDVPHWRASLTAENERGFIIRFTLLAVALLIIPWILSLPGLAGPLRYLVPASAAAILSLTFLRRPAEALLALALFVLFYDTTALRVGEVIKQVDEMAVGLIALIAFVQAARTWRGWLWLPRDITVAVVALSGLISSLAAGVPVEVWLAALVLIAKPIAFLYAVTWSRFRVWEIHAALAIVLVVAIGVLALGLVELVNPFAFRQLLGMNEIVPTRGTLPVVRSVFVHPVLFAWFTAFVALFLYARFVVTGRWRWLILAFLFSIGPFLAARRRAILALLVGLTAAFLESVRRMARPAAILRAWSPIALSVTLLVVVFMPGLVGLYELTIERYAPVPQPTPPIVVEGTPAPGAPAPTIVDSDDAPQARLALYRGSIEIARDYFPLGGGMGRFGSWMSRIEYSPLYYDYGLSNVYGLRPSSPRFVTDTFWPQILGELGVIGLAAYAGFLASLAYLLWREARRAATPIMRLLTLGAGMVFAQSVVESLASAMYHSPPRVYLLLLAVGVVASLAWRRKVATAADGDRVLEPG